MIDNIDELQINKIIKAYLIDGISHRNIEKTILGIDSPTRGGGFKAMKILHKLGINNEKKGILKNIDIDDEIKSASGEYRKTLLAFKDKTKSFVIEESEHLESNNVILIKKNKNLIKKKNLNSNNKHEILNKAFDFMLPVLPGFIGNILQKNDKNTWWQKFVLNNLPPNVIRNLPKNGTYDEYIDKLDISLCFKIIIQNWQYIFKDIIKNIKFSWVHELVEIRNDVSHWSTEKSTSYTLELINHALNVMKLFMDSININVANQIYELKREFENEYKGE